MQLVDVLSMIYTTCILFHASFSHGQTARIAVLLASALVSFAVSITADYLQDTVFHENTYGILTTIMLLRSVWIMEGYIRQMRREKECMAPSADDHDDRHDHDHNGAATANGSAEWYKTLERVRRDVRMLRTMFTTSLSIFLGGFAVRSLDNRYCSTLHRWREEIGLPWGIFLECHGWW
jgi:dihydroceramidase